MGLIGDWVNATISDFMSGMVEQLMAFAWSWIGGAFGSEISTLSPSEWNAATSVAGKFVPIMAVIAVGLASIELIAAIIAGKNARILACVVMTAAAWPITAGATWATIHLTGAADNLALQMMAGPGGGEEFTQAMLSTVGVSMGLNCATGGCLVPTQVPLAYLTVVLGLTLIMWILSLVLSLVMAFRSFALLVLVAFAPVALMLQTGGRALSEIRRKWVTNIVALLLAKPIAAGMILLAVGLMSQGATAGSGTLQGADGIAMGMIGMGMACMSPKFAQTFVAFAGIQMIGFGGGGSGSGQILKSTVMHMGLNSVLGGVKGLGMGAGKPATNPGGTAGSAGSASTGTGGAGGRPGTTAGGGGSGGGKPGGTSAGPSGKPDPSGNSSGGGTSPSQGTDPRATSRPGREGQTTFGSPSDRPTTSGAGGGAGSGPQGFTGPPRTRPGEGFSQADSSTLASPGGPGGSGLPVGAGAGRPASPGGLAGHPDRAQAGPVGGRPGSAGPSQAGGGARAGTPGGGGGGTPGAGRPGRGMARPVAFTPPGAPPPVAKTLSGDDDRTGWGHVVVPPGTSGLAGTNRWEWDDGDGELF